MTLLGETWVEATEAPEKSATSKNLCKLSLAGIQPVVVLQTSILCRSCNLRLPNSTPTENQRVLNSWICWFNIKFAEIEWVQIHLSSRQFGEIGMCQISSMVAFPNHCLSCWMSLPELSELRSWETSKVSSGLTLLWEWDIRNPQILPYPDWATITNWNTSCLWDEIPSAH